MKRIISMLAFAASFALASGQGSIDALFSKYAGVKGFTTVTISGDLLKFASKFDDDENNDRLPGKIDEIRILAQEDHDMKTENFYDMVMKDINTSEYEEFMKIRESDQDVRMLVKTDGDRFREFLFVSGGEDNVIIQIKGDLTFREAKKLSSDFCSDHGRRCFIADQK